MLEFKSWQSFPPVSPTQKPPKARYDPVEVNSKGHSDFSGPGHTPQSTICRVQETIRRCSSLCRALRKISTLLHSPVCFMLPFAAPNVGVKSVQFGLVQLQSSALPRWDGWAQHTEMKDQGPAVLLSEKQKLATLWWEERTCSVLKSIFNFLKTYSHLLHISSTCKFSKGENKFPRFTNLTARRSLKIVSPDFVWTHHRSSPC